MVIIVRFCRSPSGPFLRYEILANIADPSLATQETAESEHANLGLCQGSSDHYR